MKRVYQVGGDFFVAAAFISFFIGIVLKVSESLEIGLSAKAEPFVIFATISLLFSIALSLIDLTQKK